MIRTISQGALAACNVPLRPLGVQVFRNQRAEATFGRRIRQLVRTRFAPKVALN
jgi:hypothetical protein